MGKKSNGVDRSVNQSAESVIRHAKREFPTATPGQIMAIVNDTEGISPEVKAVALAKL